MIQLRDALRDMRQSSKPFELTWWTADTKQNTGGKLMKEMCMVKQKDTGTVSFDVDPNDTPAKKHSRNPHHDANDTINLVLHPSGEIRTAHVRLIESLNGQKVLW